MASQAIERMARLAESERCPHCRQQRAWRLPKTGEWCALRCSRCKEPMWRCGNGVCPESNNDGTPCNGTAERYNPDLEEPTT